MADLKVSYSSLDHSERSLHHIATVLEGAEARRDTNAGIWGSSEVAGAMVEFVNNWDRYRGKLVESLNNVAGMCASTKRSFSGSDQKLAAELTQAGKD